ncbi:MAG: YkgJ family cysteine cluster protein [Candidatus Omnitrophica bacterium]|nr:YkgJ family cysteine cluster protein [Candidatus Omnitrophota bacterium]
MHPIETIRLFTAIRRPYASDRQAILNVLSVYRQADTAIRRFQRQTGLRCISGCGACCEKHDFDTTMLELMPLAFSLWCRGTLDFWHTRALAAREGDRCIFYNAHPGTDSAGRCLMYPLRPLVCRLFGFTAQDDKYGAPRLVACASVKKVFPRSYERATALTLREGAPKMSHFSLRLLITGDEVTRKRLFINAGFLKASERIERITRRQRDSCFDVFTGQRPSPGLAG